MIDSDDLLISKIDLSDKKLILFGKMLYLIS